MNETVDLQQLYRGELSILEPGVSSRSLGQWALAVVAEAFGNRPEELDPGSFRAALDVARARVASAEGWEVVRQCLAEVGLRGPDLLLDLPRLRAVSPGLEHVPEAAPVFYAHRDTWYANPQAQVNGWLPLHDVNASNSFRFFFDDFSRVVANDSELFEASSFESQGGFGRTSRDPASAYPRALDIADGKTWDVVLERDALLFFSAAHLHQTQPNRTSSVRFSLDFRFLRPFHEAEGLGAPNVDNRSRGSVAHSYRPCL